VVNLHWGNEFQRAPSGFQLALARRLASSPDITAIVGQHAHIVQPIRWIRRTPIVFGEGNLLSNQTSACCPAASQDGLLAVLHVTVGRGGRGRARRVEYLPTWVRHPDYAVLPVGDGLARGLGPRGALRASWRRTVAAAGRSARVRPVPARLP
jgi:poly-gamma-glutamate synthesis protein (capsule biosynthesis protein)